MPKRGFILEATCSIWTRIRKMKYFARLLPLRFLVIVLAIVCPSSVHGSMIEDRILYAGQELFKETLPLQNGVCRYQLHGLKPHTWYEVKISYPASIPSRFTLQLLRGDSDLGLKRGRKLLNTEKLIFKTDGSYLTDNKDGTSVLVSVEPEGIVAIPGKQEREHTMFNIVCDELLLGITHKAWYVAVLVLFCLVFAFVLPSFLPPFLLPRNGSSPPSSSKSS